jgi:hypothetical protein
MITMDVFGKGGAGLGGLGVTPGGGTPDNPQKTDDKTDPQKTDNKTGTQAQQQEKTEGDVVDLSAGDGTRSLKTRGLAQLQARRLKAARGLKIVNGKLRLDLSKHNVELARKLRGRSLDSLVVGDPTKAGTAGTIREEALADSEQIMSYVVRYYEAQAGKTPSPQ